MNHHDTPAWTSAPDETDTTIPVKIIRVPANGLANFLCLSGQPVGCYTHFVSRRTVPCLGEDCPICEAGITRRWYGWLYGKSPKSDFRAIVEYTASASQIIQSWLLDHGTLRGATINWERTPQKPNGRLWCRPRWSNIPNEELPPNIDIPSILQKMWEQAKWLYDSEQLKKHQKAVNRLSSRLYSDVPGSNNGNH